MTKRRDFIKGLSAMGLLTALPNIVSSAPKIVMKNSMSDAKESMIWGLLLHLSFNMWEEYVSSSVPITEIRGYRPYLRLSEELWDDALAKMSKEGLNMVVIDLGNAVKFESHPEIAVRNAWSVHRLRNELDKIRKMGIEPIPKLNFSAGHDTWLKSYSRMLSTEKYYTVCSDLIKEVSDIFNKPRFFHLGMDEENAANQKYYDYLVIRQNDLWWGDFYFLIGEVEKNDSRPWIWSDYYWEHPDLFLKKMPKSVLQSNWYYDAEFNKKSRSVQTYIDLEKKGYEQVPTASNWGGLDYKSKDGQKSMINTVKFCSDHISSDRLFGFLQTSWVPTVEKYRDAILDSIQLTGEAKRWYEQNK